MDNTARVRSLDSIRGLAALTVVFHHCLIAFPMYCNQGLYYANSALWVVNMVTYSPLHVLWEGHEAVILFFVLSGFVLSLPYYRSQPIRYWMYVLKRLFRIYVPYGVAILLSAILLELFIPKHGVATLSVWFNSLWAHTITAHDVEDLFLMFGNSNVNVDTTTWSLVHELRISLILPFMTVFVRRAHFLAATIAGTAVIVLGHHWAALPFKLGWTIYYSGFFIYGSILARYRDQVHEYVIARTVWWKVTVFFSAIALYSLTWWLPVPTLRDPKYGDVLVALSSLVFITLSTAWPYLQRTLNRQVLLEIGKLSYSLYLIHPVVLLTTVYLFKGWGNPTLAVLVTPILTLPTSYIFHRAIESPAQALGRYVVTGVGRKQYGDILRRV